MSGVLPEYRTAIGWRARLLRTRAPGWSILVRLLVGLVVFLPEGIQKLIFPDILGAGRFASIGIPYPELMGPFVGIVEIICGTLTRAHSACGPPRTAANG
jgi:putative oxidoreductase